MNPSESQFHTVDPVGVGHSGVDALMAGQKHNDGSVRTLTSAPLSDAPRVTKKTSD